MPPSLALGKAIDYAKGQWPKLITYVEDGRLDIDNNGVENAIRPFAVGCKNWLFSHRQHGATASANLYSLIESAKANGLNDYAYLRVVFTELPKIEPGEIEQLLPWLIDTELLDQQMIKAQDVRN